MFNNIGKKIKALAIVICWIGIIVSLILSFVMFNIAANVWGNEGLYITWGIVILVGGILLSWIGSFFMYGFGELIDQTCSINRKISGDLKSEEETKKEYNRNSQLETLRSQGIITEEEYQQARQNNK